MLQEHERGLGNNQAELAEWVGLFTSAHGAVKVLADAMPGLEINARRMRENIAAIKGLVFTESLYMLVAPHIGKTEAQDWVEQLSRRVIEQDRQLFEVALEALAQDTQLAAKVSEQQLLALFDLDKVAAQAQRRASKPLRAMREQWQALAATPHFEPVQTQD
jgi:3-carboxy-cis,cis-muconate cycloisomerase